MKKILVFGFIIAVCMLIIPITVTKKEKNAVKQTVAAAAQEAPKSAPASESGKKSAGQDAFRIKTGDKIVTLTAQQYVTGVVSAEMPPSFSTEALKAQSVAAYSFALYKRAASQNAEYDLTDSYKTDQSYLSEDVLREKWGDSYAEKAGIISKAVAAVAGEYLSFEGKPALTMYHALSSGATNSCADVFGGNIPYLVSVQSRSDLLSPDYKSVFSFAGDELCGKLSSVKQASGDNLLGGIKTAENGLVEEISFAGVKITGSKLSGLLGLPSPNFSVSYSDNAYTFTCLGRGHGVGMSQYGANQMALTGSTYKEILAHYYPGTELVKQ